MRRRTVTLDEARHWWRGPSRPSARGGEQLLNEAIAILLAGGAGAGTSASVGPGRLRRLPAQQLARVWRRPWGTRWRIASMQGVRKPGWRSSTFEAPRRVEGTARSRHGQEIETKLRALSEEPPVISIAPPARRALGRGGATAAYSTACRSLPDW